MYFEICKNEKYQKKKLEMKLNVSLKTILNLEKLSLTKVSVFSYKCSLFDLFWPRNSKILKSVNKGYLTILIMGKIYKIVIT